MITLKDKIIELHDTIINETGGIQGIIDEGMLESALAAPFITFDGKDLYPTIIEKATRLGFGIACNHAFIDGNKRTGAVSMNIFLEYNFEDDDIVDIFSKITKHQINYNDLLNLINDHLLKRMIKTYSKIVL